MTDYIGPTLTTGADELLGEKIDRFQADNPSWTPFDASPEVRLMRDQSVDDAVLTDVVSQVSKAIFRWYGQVAYGLAPQDATYAQADVTFTLTASGFTIPADFRIAIDAGGGESIGFVVLQDTLATDTTPTVQVQAVDPGAAGSGIQPGAEITVVDQRTWITGAELDTETIGGEDAETDDEYLARLRTILQRQSDTIVTVDDAEEALAAIPGIGRVLILDNQVPASTAAGLRYDGTAPTGSNQTGVAGALWFVAISGDGSNVASGVKDAAIAMLIADRLAGVSVYGTDPTRTDVTVTFKFISAPGWDDTDVGDRGEAAIAGALAPGNWGVTSTAGGAINWEDALLVRYADLYATLKQTQGLLHVTELKINGNADTNLTLTGPGALPNLVSVTGTAA